MTITRGLPEVNQNGRLPIVIFWGVVPRRLHGQSAGGHGFEDASLQRRKTWSKKAAPWTGGDWESWGDGHGNVRYLGDIIN